MWHIRKIFSFAWTYLRPYRGRLFLGILASFIYAGSNGGFVWVTRAFTGRFEDKDEALAGLTVTNFSITTVFVTNDLAATQVQTNYIVNSYSVSNAAKAVKPETDKKPKVSTALTKWLREKSERLKAVADTWLPRVGEPINWRHVVMMVLILPLVAVVRGIMDYTSNYCLNWASARGVRDLRIDVMSKLATLSLDYFTRAKIGDLLTRVNVDTQTIARAFASGAPDLFKESVTLVFVFGILLSTDWKLTLAAMIILPACAVPLIVLGVKTRKAAKRGRTINALQTSQLVEFVSGIRVIKAFNLERAEIERFRVKSAEFVRAGMKGVQAKESIGPVIEIISAVGLGLLLLYVFAANRDASNLPAFVVAFMLLFNSIRKLAAVHMLYEQAHISVDRLVDIMEEKPKIIEAVSPRPLAAFKSDITFSGVSFGYRDNMVLRETDLRIPRGFKLGIAGKVGSGKTTLVNLLFRFYDPTQGAIKMDGQDLREISVHELRQQMALVSQDIVLFDLTVAENIALGKPGATRTEIEQAARAASAHEFITQLPQGYDTYVGERGASLSGGQKQRICIARAFVRNAPILVLDEATSSLDSNSEAEVQVAIDHLAEHRTVVCIAHRLSTLAAMDQIIVLSEGSIVERGSFEELLEKGGLFAEMAARQGFFAAKS